ncbi:tetratricopeptide repeat protein [Rhodoferax sp.]|uniref:L,D-transpeptidase Cds6 family protein n=1 Tax=Rhodoferax sp. TaxID=50421 RepID=UPI00260B71B3|nr:tetratricopeptide repeat protein [Rhodoferax sp.]MDD2809012.1 tetratricopeptide repeat protein [Rhodoferax sp.]
MKHNRSVLLKTLRLLTLVGACTAQFGHADEYTDVSQLVRTNKFSEALTLVDSHLTAKPADPQMRFLKGVIQRNLNKTVEAITTFTKLTEDYPELPEPYNNLAVLYAGQGQYDKARLALEMAIRTNPSYATAHENLGDVYARLASQAYNKALQLDSGNMVVPPKLALIREVFKPNLTNARPGAGTTVVAAAAPIATPAPAVSVPSAKPTQALTPAAALPTPTAVAVPAKPVPPVAVAATPTAKPAPAPATADAEKTVEAAVIAWAQAWSGKDMAGYLAAYSPDFDTPGKQSRSAWEKDRTDRITGKSRISVKLTELNIKVTGDEAVARFRQAYKADSLSVSSRKTLHLKKQGAGWLITREATGN